MSETTGRKPRRSVVGIVTSAKMDKTRRVEVPRMTKHPKYNKFVKRRTICYAHDPNNEAVVGDQVEIMECRPLSKLKRWRLVRVLKHEAALLKDETLVDPLAEPQPSAE